MSLGEHTHKRAHCMSEKCPAFLHALGRAPKLMLLPLE
jgi:hypothetical protein